MDLKCDAKKMKRSRIEEVIQGSVSFMHHGVLLLTPAEVGPERLSEVFCAEASSVTVQT